MKHLLLLHLLLLTVTITSSRPISSPVITCVECVQCNGVQKVNINLVNCDGNRQARQTFLGDNNTPVIKYSADNEVTGTMLVLFMTSKCFDLASIVGGSKDSTTDCIIVQDWRYQCIFWWQ